MGRATHDHCHVSWLGTATFVLTIAILVVFLDAYMDRVRVPPPVGLARLR